MLVENGFLTVRLSRTATDALTSCAEPVKLDSTGPCLERAMSHAGTGGLAISRPPHMPSCSCTQLLELLPCDEASPSGCCGTTDLSLSWAALMHAGQDALRAIEMEARAPAGSLTELVCTSAFGAQASALGEGSKWRWILYDRPMLPSYHALPHASSPQAERDASSLQGAQELCAPHTDGGLITVSPASNVQGLELRAADGTWQPADVDTTDVLIFGGDCSKRIRSIPCTKVTPNSGPSPRPPSYPPPAHPKPEPRPCPKPKPRPHPHHTC